MDFRDTHFGFENWSCSLWFRIGTVGGNFCMTLQGLGKAGNFLKYMSVLNEWNIPAFHYRHIATIRKTRHR
jgi:hypothetical protein